MSARHHASWDSDRRFFCAQLRAVGLSYDDIADFCAAQKWPRPSELAPERRARLLALLAPGEDVRARLDAWLAGEGRAFRALLKLAEHIATHGEDEADEARTRRAAKRALKAAA